MTESAPFAKVQDLSAAFARLVGIAAPGIVAVQSGHSRSSGFFWRPGLIVTADEALPEEDDLAVTLPGGDAIEARLAGRDPTTDIALLRVGRSDVPPVPLESRPVPVGALAMAIGAEDGAPTAAFGVVSRAAGPWHSLRGGDIGARIELDVRLRQSAEGGLAIDAAGQAIGMMQTWHVCKQGREAVSERLVLDIERQSDRGCFGDLAQVFGLSAIVSGMSFVALSGPSARKSDRICVEPQGPGAKAGVHQGDIIVTWNGEPIRQLVGCAANAPGARSFNASRRRNVKQIDRSPSWHIRPYGQVSCWYIDRQTRCGRAHRRRRPCSPPWRYSSLIQVLATSAANDQDSSV